MMEDNNTKMSNAENEITIDSVITSPEDSTKDKKKFGCLKPLMGHRHKSNKLDRGQSFIAEKDLTPAALEIWSDLPEEIKNDPYLAQFKIRYEKQYGSKSNFNANLKLFETRLMRKHPKLIRQNSDFITYKSGNRRSSVISQRRTSDSDKEAYSPKVTSPSTQNPQENASSSDEAGPSQNNKHLPSVKNENSEHVHNIAVTNEESNPWIRNIKIAILLLCWIIFTAMLLIRDETVDQFQHISVPVDTNRNIIIFERPIPSKISIKLMGPFVPERYKKLSNSHLSVWLEAANYKYNVNMNNKTQVENVEVNYKQALSSKWQIPLFSEEVLNSVPDQEETKIFDITPLVNMSMTNTFMRIMLKSNLRIDTPVNISYNTKPVTMENGIIYAALILIGLYALIIFEIVHRTFAAMLASTVSVGVLTILGERPTSSQLMGWIDVETLLLLFAMMVIVAIVSETGIFDYLAVYAYKVTAGRVWPLINCLYFFTFIMSSFLDNVTTLLLMTPVTIRLCEVMELNPVPILMSMIIFSNIGGTLTPVGDPPNVIIASNSNVQNAGIDFTTFTLHMLIGILLVVVQAYIHLRVYFKNISSLRYCEPKDVIELQRQISIWQRAASSLTNYSKDEDFVRNKLVKKVNRMQAQLKSKIKAGTVEVDTYKATLHELTEKYPIRDKVLLVKSTVAVTFVIIVFFLHSLPELQHLSLGWTALLGALLLLILSDRADMEAVLARVEWSTLLFFAALFIVMEALAKLGLINWIGKRTELVIMSVSEDSRLAVAILLILWVSAITSAFVDNIPLTTMMIRIAIDLGNNPELNLPLQPLVWSLAFGACLGGNGTLIGASTNVVCAGVAEQHGYRFSFMEYFKVGFPIMLGSIVVVTGYLLVCHCVFQWH